MSDMLDLNIDVSPSAIPLQTASAGQLPSPIFEPSPGSTFVGTLNAQTGNVALGGGSTGFAFPSGGGVITMTGPLTTKGDLYTRTGATGIRLAVGGDNSRLAADSTQATGLTWINASTGWTAWTGAATRTSQATYPTTTASVGYIQAELQGVMDALKHVTEAFKAALDDLKSQKLFNT